MKKIILMAAALVLAAATVSAQPRAIGARLGYGISASYQHTVGQNMITADLDVPGFMNLGATATYDWLNPFGANIPWGTTSGGEWNWYLGAGLSGGFDIANAVYNGLAGIDHHYTGGYFGAAGRAGLEYTFGFGLQLAAEWRPTIGVSIYTDKYDDGSGHAIRDTDAAFFAPGLWAGAISFCVRYRFGM